jgi:hypothetical protein
MADVDINMMKVTSKRNVSQSFPTCRAPWRAGSSEVNAEAGTVRARDLSSPLPFTVQ